MASTVVMTAPYLAPEAAALLRAAGLQLHCMEPYPTAAAVAALAGRVDARAIISRQGPVTAAAMDAAPNLRIVARHGVGVDDVDLAEARRRGILVTRAPGSNTAAVAEHALALILALVKRLPQQAATIADGGWRGPADGSGDLAGLRLGLVGLGTIGRRVAVLGQAFGMRVTAYSPFAPELPGIARVPSLEALLPGAEMLSLHCPLRPDTYHLVAAPALAALPSGAFLVNTARGGLVDETALLAALESGHLAGAALDVFETEPPPPDHPLRRHPRLIATAHAAGATPGSLVRMGMMAAECVVAALTGQPVPPERIV
jgi:D-3-phosphoglycerate dehydrogenase